MKKNENKINPSHLNRNAYIYIRQSTEHQVRENIESQQRQYELVDLARQYQWNESSIIVISNRFCQVSGRCRFRKSRYHFGS